METMMDTFFSRDRLIRFFLVCTIAATSFAFGETEAKKDSEHKTDETKKERTVLTEEQKEEAQKKAGAKKREAYMKQLMESDLARMLVLGDFEEEATEDKQPYADFYDWVLKKGYDVPNYLIYKRSKDELEKTEALNAAFLKFKTNLLDFGGDKFKPTQGLAQASISPFADVAYLYYNYLINKEYELRKAKREKINLKDDTEMGKLYIRAAQGAIGASFKDDVRTKWLQQSYFEVYDEEAKKFVPVKLETQQEMVHGWAQEILSDKDKAATYDFLRIREMLAPNPKIEYTREQMTEMAAATAVYFERGFPSGMNQAMDFMDATVQLRDKSRIKK